MDFIKKLWAIVFPPSVSGAVAGIEQAVKNLTTVEAHHAAQQAKAELKAAVAAAKAKAHDAEVKAASAVKANIQALLNKV